MKKLLFILPLLVACSTESPISANGMCSCSKETQHQNIDGSYATTDHSAPSPDACYKNGLIEYTNSRTYRVLWHCN